MTSKQILSELKKAGYEVINADDNEIQVLKHSDDNNQDYDDEDDSIVLKWNITETTSCCGVKEIEEIYFNNDEDNEEAETLMLAYMLSKSFEEENRIYKGKKHRPLIIFSNNISDCKHLAMAVVNYATEYVQLFESINPGSNNTITAYARYNNPYKTAKKVKIAVPKKTKQQYVRS